MNVMFVAGIVLLGTLVGAPAQTPQTSRSATIDVEERAGNANALNSWRSVYGSSERTLAMTRNYTIVVRNLSAQPGEFDVEWFLVAKPAGGSRRFVYDRGQRHVSLKGGAFEKLVVAGKELSNYRYHSAVSDRTWKSGTKADGWVVRVKADGEVIRIKTSDPQLEQMVKKPEEFDRFIAPK